MSNQALPMPIPKDAIAFEPIIAAFRTWVEALVGYMKRAAQLLENLYAGQDQAIEQLRALCAKTHSLRHADFDDIFGKVLTDRHRTRASAATLVDQYRVGREAIIHEVRDLLTTDINQAVKTWPILKQRLLGGEDDQMHKIVSVLREIHIEQEKITTALSGLLTRGEKLKIDELKTVAQKLAGGGPPEAAELAALLAVCDSAGHEAGLNWQRLAV